MTDVDNLKLAVAERLVLARKGLNHTQKELVSRSGIPLPSLRDYELGKTIPGGEAIAKLVSVGINANWLLTGDGPMLITELQTKAPTTRINRGALAALLRGAVAITAEGMSVEAAADMAAEMYERALDAGEISADGIGDGNLDKAA